MRRKQTSIRFSRSALSHRYLRYISWNSHRPPQAGFFHTVPQSAHTSFSRRRLYPKAAIVAALPLLPPGGQANALRSFPKKKRNNLLPFFHALLACRSFCIALPASLARATSDPSAASPSPALASSSAAFPQTKNAGPRHCAANPLTTFVKRAQKSVDFSLKKNTRRHARLSRSCFGRNRRPAFTTAPFPFSFFTKEKKKENRSKFSRFEYIARTHFVRPHDVRDWPVAPRPLKFM